ncbi:MAG: hypothetical protein LBL04_13470 [Bacteroidales bacterium]|jgi:hypothetical protein|nr:hypothetical protein [Bacteroidales bacterium]
MKYKAVIFLLFALLATVHGQNNITREHHVTPVTPEAAALAKMVNYPINHNTGIPQISIPLYEIKTGGMVLPVDLVYHAGGFKINEHAGRVGLGWSLSCDLQITRTVYGADDFATGGYFSDTDMKPYTGYSSNPYPITNGGDPTHMMNRLKLAKGQLDGMPDKFYYKLLNKSGSFFFQKNGSSYTIVPVPFDNIKIEYIEPGINRYSGSFVITDTDGTVYYFGLPGYVVDISEDPAPYGIEFSGNAGGTPSIRTTWKCMHIDNANFSESITFTYSKQYAGGGNVYEGKEICTYRDKIEYWNTFQYNLSLITHPRRYADDINIVPEEYELLFSKTCRFFQLSSPKYMVSYGGVKKEFHLPYLDSSYQPVDKTYRVKNEAGPNHDPLADVNYVISLKLDKISYRGGKIEFIGDMNQINQIVITDNQHTKTIQLFQSFTLPTPMTLAEAQKMNGLHFQGTNYLDSIRTGDDKHTLMYHSRYCFGNHLKGHDAWGHVNSQTHALTSYNMTYPIFTVPKHRGTIRHRTANITKPFYFIEASSVLAEQPDEQLMQSGMLKRIVYPTGGFVDFDFEANKYEERYDQPYSGTNYVLRNGGGLRIRSINYYTGDSYQASEQKYYRYGDYEEGAGIVANAPEVTRNHHSDSWNWEWDYKGYDYTQIINYHSVDDFGHLLSTYIPVRDSVTVYLPASSLDYTYSSGAPAYYTKVTEYRQDMGAQTGKTVYRYYQHDRFFNDGHWRPVISGTNIPYVKVDWHLGALESVAQYRYQGGKFQLSHLKKMEYNHTIFRKTQMPRVVYSFPHIIPQSISGDSSGDNAYNLYDFWTGEYGLQTGKLVVSKETEQWIENPGDTIVQVTDYTYGNSNYIQPTKIEKTGSGGTQVITLEYPYNRTGAVYQEMKNKNIISPVLTETIKDKTTGAEISKVRLSYRKETGKTWLVRDSIKSSVQGQPLTEELHFDRYDDYENVLQTTGRGLAVQSYLWGYAGRYLVAEIENASHVTASALLSTDMMYHAASTTENAVKTELEKLYQLPGAMVNAYTWQPLTGVKRHISPQKLSVTYEYDPHGRLKTMKDHDQKVLQSFDYKMRKAPSYSNVMFYTNMPRMETDLAICNSGEKAISNCFRPGGQEYLTQPEYSTGGPFPQWGLLEYDTSDACTSAAAFVKITLTSAFLDSPSRYVIFDFVKDGSIVATKTYQCYSTYPLLPSHPQSGNPLDIYLPAGEYHVVVRSGTRAYSELHLTVCYYSDPADLKYITHRDKINLQAGLSYTFILGEI